MITQDPRGIDWDYWCRLMVEQFAGNQLPVVPETHWRQWADSVSSIGYFGQSGVADSRNFDSWQDWAKHLTETMSVL